ncbi:MAG: hypothetical protein ACR2LN_03680 [Candidatus Levyibacteriota bacterium]
MSERVALNDQHLQANRLFDVQTVILDRRANKEEQGELFNLFDRAGYNSAMKALIENTSDPYKKVNIIEGNLPLLQPPAKVAHLISIRAGSLPFGEGFGEDLAITQYDLSMQMDKPTDAYTIARLMLSS